MRTALLSLLFAAGVALAEEGAPKPLTFGGFIHADAIFFDQDPLSTLRIADVQDVANFRRARLIATGEIAEEIDYRFGVDFGGPGRPSFLDTWVDFTLLGTKAQDDADAAVVRLGRFKAPQGMAALEASTDLIFLERSTPLTFVPFRQAGVRGLGTYGERSGTWSVAGYRYAANVFGAVAGDPGYGVAGRLTRVFGAADAGLLHVGASSSTQTPNDGNLRFQATPGVGFNELDFRSDASPVPSFIDTGNFDAGRYDLHGLELAGSIGPVLLRSEAFAAFVGLPAGGRADFGGAYAEAAWVVVGNARPYDRLRGLFGGLTPETDVPDGGPGALELALRYDAIDLSDAAVERGGTLSNWTLGATWAWTPRLKFQANYVLSDAERDNEDAGTARITAVRMQYVF